MSAISKEFGLVLFHGFWTLCITAVVTTHGFKTQDVPPFEQLIGNISAVAAAVCRQAQALQNTTITHCVKPDDATRGLPIALFVIAALAGIMPLWPFASRLFMAVCLLGSDEIKCGVHKTLSKQDALIAFQRMVTVQSGMMITIRYENAVHEPIAVFSQISQYEGFVEPCSGHKSIIVGQLRHIAKRPLPKVWGNFWRVSFDEAMSLSLRLRLSDNRESGVHYLVSRCPTFSTHEMLAAIEAMIDASAKTEPKPEPKPVATPEPAAAAHQATVRSYFYVPTYAVTPMLVTCWHGEPPAKPATAPESPEPAPAPAQEPAATRQDAEQEEEGAVIVDGAA